MEPFRTIESRTIVLPQQNIDTDQIIPARFLKGTSRAGLARGLFAGWRYDGQGRALPDFPLNAPGAQDAKVLVAGANFGCGSSREHAAWALLEFGFRAVVSSSIADIFRNNAIKNGLLPVEVEPATHARLLATPGGRILVDLEAQALSLSDGVRTSFSIDAFARHCLLSGLDELGFLLSHEGEIAAHEESR